MDERLQEIHKQLNGALPGLTVSSELCEYIAELEGRIVKLEKQLEKLRLAFWESINGE